MPPVVIEKKFGWQNRYADDSVFCKKKKKIEKKKDMGVQLAAKRKRKTKSTYYAITYNV